MIRTASPPLPLAGVPQVLHCLQHRGPDGQGWLRYTHGRIETGQEWRGGNDEPDVVLLHRRLSILDLSDAGSQPMASPDGRLQVVFNGEIYNYIELRDRLRALGYRFHSNCDTEVLLAAFSAWGTDALRQFVGMFALALLDTERRTVLLARDFFGIKPLYYRHDGCFTFASELKALLELKATTRQVDPGLLYLFLRFGLSGHSAQTMFSGIAQLPAGHYLEIPLDAAAAAQPVPYWTPETHDRSTLSFSEAARELRELFLENVRLHLRSDVPLGAALSGGIDSSAIVMAIRHLEPKVEINTFSFIADEPSINEERWVDIVGAAAGARVHKVRAGGNDLVSDLESLTSSQDEPLASTSPYAQYCVFRRARQAGVTVMLDGQGAEEILAGYRYFLAARLASLLRAGEWGRAQDFLQRASRTNAIGCGWLLLKAGSYLLPATLQPAMRRLVGQELMPPWLNPRWFQSHGVQPQPVYSLHDSEILRGTLLQELTATSLPQLLRYEDRNSMAFSIESRVPFLTPKLVNFVLSLPEEYIVAADGTSKAVFRQAMRGLVPDCILDRHDKIGFATPEQHWLQAVRPWVERILRSDAAAAIPAFNHRRLASEWENVCHRSHAFGSHLWRALNVIKWTEQFGVQFG